MSLKAAWGGGQGRTGPALVVSSGPTFGGTRWHQHRTVHVRPTPPSLSHPIATPARGDGEWHLSGRGAQGGFASTPPEKQNFQQKENHATHFYTNSVLECQTTSLGPAEGQVGSGGEQSSTRGWGSPKPHIRSGRERLCPGLRREEPGRWRGLPAREPGKPCRGQTEPRGRKY